MIQKILFIKMIWSIMRGKQKGFIFFRLTDDQQKDFINNSKSININIRFLGVDERVVKKIAQRLEE
jgi:hypothetical protein